MKAERKHDKDHIPKEQKNENVSPRFEENANIHMMRANP